MAVAALPPGSDPGEMARSDPEGLRAAIEGAKPFLRFRVERILDDAELTTPEGRAKAADNALAAVAEHPDNLVRDQYVMQVAERCHSARSCSVSGSSNSAVRDPVAPGRSRRTSRGGQRVGGRTEQSTRAG